MTTIRVTRRPRTPRADAGDLTATGAQRAFSAATDPGNQEQPTALLDALSAAGPPVPTPRSAALPLDREKTGVWESEGGHHWSADARHLHE
ncbi:hypothetical protein [Geodermatophilus sp. CPCC 206100]|uniref:hypothetical protein n=1 Tax=Geodermatophilus sp. CPCC 206100 TaxID=3020054 RepID=UPI003B00A717